MKTDTLGGPRPAERLISLDLFRGIIMVLLMLESTGLYGGIARHTSGVTQALITQFFHHTWHGLRFWDLIQPGFMFIAGTALAFSLHKQDQQGVPWRQSLGKQLKRSCWLFFWGVLDYAIRDHNLSFELWDVLTQLSFTSLVAFLIYRWSAGKQIAVSIGLLVLAEALYRLSNVPGFNQPFTDQHNFGNYVDWLLMRKVNPEGWVAINCLSTAAHTIWGVVAGKLLLSSREGRAKVTLLVGAGIGCVVAGFLMDATVTPIIKRIATTSFVLASGGWVLLGLAAAYWWVDLLGHRRRLDFFTIVSMNSLFIYLFFEIVGNRWFTGYVTDLTTGLMRLASIPTPVTGVVAALAVFALEWKMCQFLYRRGIFFKV